jgi:predicted enzyme related to lactoylglutathione lyase
MGGVMKLEHKKINYVEFPAEDLDGTKVFFQQAFGWTFQDFGPDYSAFENSGLMGGFFRSNLASSTTSGAALIVLYSEALEKTQQDIVRAGGKIVKEIFSFPGGRRFHFQEPSGNELAVWSDK